MPSKFLVLDTVNERFTLEFVGKSFIEVFRCVEVRSGILTINYFGSTYEFCLDDVSAIRIVDSLDDFRRKPSRSVLEIGHA